MMRLASIILATARPDAAAEPNVDETVQLDEIEAHVSVVKDAPSVTSSALPKAALMRRSSHSRATAAAAPATSCDVGSKTNKSKTKETKSRKQTQSTGVTQRRVKLASCRPIGAN